MMLANYLQTGVRNLLRYKLYSAINVLGLAVGLTCCFLIALFVTDELSHDRQYVNAERIYRISKDIYGSDGNRDQFMAAHAPQMAPLLKQDFDQIEQAARVYCCGNLQVSRDERVFLESEGVQFADNELFEIFDFTWLRGDAVTALAAPFTAVLTEGMARKYFGAEDPLGGTLLIEGQLPVRITGVLGDLPHNTHFDFQMLVSMSTATAAFGEAFVENWGSNNFHTYVLLEDGADIGSIQQQSQAFFERHLGAGGVSAAGFTAMPLADIHLRSEREFEMRTPGSLTMVYAFGAIAVLILFIACINFMNLATARATQRAKEVGMRKAIGAGRWQVIAQFLGESLVLVLVAVVMALALAELLLPLFRTFVQQQLTGYLSDPLLVIALLLLLTLGVGALAGAYPAFYMSAFRPALVLRGDLSTGNAAARLRKGLVITQFAIAVMLLIATGTMLQQLRFVNALDLGYDTEQVVVLSGTPTVGLSPQWEALKQQLRTHPDILGVNASNIVPGTPNTSTMAVRFEGGNDEGRAMAYTYVNVDYGFFETYGISTLAGRTFSEDFATDRMVEPSDATPTTTGAYIINELAARQMGWTPEEAIGKWFEVGMAPGFDKSVRGAIVGVVADVYFESLHNPLLPMVYMMPPERMGGFTTLREASIRIAANNIPATLAFIDAKWTELTSGQPLQRRFLDTDFEALYLKETRQVQVFVAFSLLAIFIASLGLFGLAAYTTERRTREIGVRKVMGGSVWSIVWLLTSNFSRLVLVSNLIAWPVAYFAMERWLENFAYRIDLTPLVFVGSGLIALCIAWVTVGGTAAKAANQKPVLALRYE